MANISAKQVSQIINAHADDFAAYAFERFGGEPTPEQTARARHDFAALKIEALSDGKQKASKARADKPCTALMMAWDSAEKRFTTVRKYDLAAFNSAQCRSAARDAALVLAKSIEHARASVGTEKETPATLALAVPNVDLSTLRVVYLHDENGEPVVLAPGPVR